MNKAAREYIRITKHNLLQYYAAVRTCAFQTSTILSAFAKTGIWPLNPNTIGPSAFQPSLNTTTQPAQPLPAILPSLLVPIPEVPDIVEPPASNIPLPSTTTTMSIDTNAPAAAAPARYLLVGLPPPLPHTASHQALRAQVADLRMIADALCIQVEKDYVQMQLMDGENEKLRKLAFTKEKKKTTSKKASSSHPQHMTDSEALDALHRVEVELLMKEVFKQAGPQFKAIRKSIDDHYKQLADDMKRQEQA